MSYQHQAQLDDPAKPHRRVYLCAATAVFVKVYAIRNDPGFGTLAWRITGSWCDANGDVLSDEQGAPRIVAQPHLITIESDAVADVADVVEQGRLYMVARVERAVLNLQAAAAA